MKRYVIPFFLVLFLFGCNSEEKLKKNYMDRLDDPAEEIINFEYPLNGTVFPPEFPAPSLFWRDKAQQSKKWFIHISAGSKELLFADIHSNEDLKLGEDIWQIIKEKSVDKPAVITILGINPEKNDEVYSRGQIQLKISQDSVGAPIFYRAVPLPFSYATSHLDSIKYMLGDISSVRKPKVILENLPVCGNCHSFSPDGKYMGMDVDAFGDKGSYLISKISKKVIMNDESFITWSDFQEKSTMALLSQISPNGQHVLSTLDDNEIFEARDQLEYSQLFFPIKGILTVYDRQEKTFKALPGASDTSYVQSNPGWSPDGKTIYFSRSKAVQRNQSGMTYGTGISDMNKFQNLRDSFLTGKKEFKFDIMEIPFNKGTGGKPESLKGASKNGKSNYFPKVSPNGKWLVFCQADNYMLLQPDSKLYIMPTDGSTPPRLMNCNTGNMNSWHSWSPNGRWLVFSSKKMGPYTQLFMTHIDENGNDSPPVWLENLKVKDRAANIPEFLNVDYDNFDQIIDEFSDVADYNVRGTSKAQFGDFKNAIVDFNKALQVDPADDQAYANRGKAKDELGDLKGALADLDKAIELNPEEHDYYIHRGNTRLKMSDIQGAIADCNQAVALQPEDAALYAHRAGVYQIASAYDKSVADLTKAINLRPEYSLYYVHRANIYNQLNQSGLAIKDIDRALAIEPGNVKNMTLKGIFAHKAENLNLAIKSFQQAIKINPAYYEPYSELGILYDELGETGKSIEYFTSAIEYYDQKAKHELAAIYNNRGTVYGKMKKYLLARNDFSQALVYRPNFSDAYSNRAFAELNLGNTREAERDCDMALQINPGMVKAMRIKEMIRGQ